MKRHFLTYKQKDAEKSVFDQFWSSIMFCPSLPPAQVLNYAKLHLIITENLDFSCIIACNQGFCTKSHGFCL